MDSLNHLNVTLGGHKQASHGVRRFFKAWNSGESAGRGGGEGATTGSVRLALTKAVVPCMGAMIEHFNDRWRDGRSMLTHRQGRRRQPRGIRAEKLRARALESRRKILYVVGDHEHDELWAIVYRRDTAIAEAEQTSRANATVYRSLCEVFSRLLCSWVPLGGKAAPERLHGNVYGTRKTTVEFFTGPPI